MNTGKSLSIAALFAAMTSLPEKAFRDVAALVPPDPEGKRLARNSVFRKQYAEPIAAAEQFNQTVNTRQVRRHYARVMRKRGVDV